MRSGTLTTTNANGICLGSYYSGVWTRYSGGAFVMSGGTVNTARIDMGMPDSVLTLQGGDVYLGSGGITSSTNNFQGTVKLGGSAIHATANWASSLRMELSGVNGNTVIDTSSRTVTLSGALQGAGGLIKTGLGTLNLNGVTNTFTGPLVVEGGTLTCGAASVFNGVSEITVTNGTLVLNGTVISSIATLRVSSTANLTLAADKSLAVDRLYISGVSQSAGTYTFGSGTVTVNPTAKIVWTGAANDSALWSTLNNWGNTAVMPDGADVALDFGYSQFSADDRIVLDLSPGVTLTNLIYDQGAPGNVLTITCPEGVTNVLTFVANGEIHVEKGQTLILDTGGLMKGPLYKYGEGTLVLNRRMYADSAADAFYFKIMQGQVRGRSEISGIRVWPSSASRLVSPPEFILEGDSALIHAQSITAPGYQNEGNDRGVFTQAGGTVDLSTLPANFGGGVWGFVLTYGWGVNGTYCLNDGMFNTSPTKMSYLAAGGATATFNQNGGTSTFYQLNLTWPWPTTGGKGTVNLCGGTLRLAGAVEKGYSSGAVNLSGGCVEALSNGVVFASDVPVSLTTGESGDVAFAQAQSSYTNTLIGTLSGSGGLVQTGPGTLSLDGVNTFDGTVSITNGILLINSELENATDIAVGGGHLELLAEAPCLTNLSVCAAGAAVTVGDSINTFAEGFTLSIAQGSVVDLRFTGIRDIAGLILGGKAKKPGLYGGSDSSAPSSSLNAFFEGTGTLRVLYGPPPQGTLVIFH